MVMDFSAPAYRAGGSDLAVSVTPMGFIDLSDEEFEVHGERMSRYATSAAMYLGHHWGYRKEQGDPQLVFNYVRALADFVTDFCFSHGITWEVPKKYQHIVPALLQRIYHRDNRAGEFFWDIGNCGIIYGDVFVKVAYENAYVDSIGFPHPGRVRLITLNPSHCFPRWHPHDKERMVEFKLKYRYWNCVDTQTEALTRDGWKKHDELKAGDDILTLNPDTDEIVWQQVSDISVHDYDGPMTRWSNHIDALTTFNHRWLAEREQGRLPGKNHPGNTLRYTRQIARTEFPLEGDPSIGDLRKGSRIVVSGGTPLEFSGTAKWSDELVETVGWYVTEGLDHYNQTGFHTIRLSQSESANPEYCTDIRRLMSYWREQGATFNEWRNNERGVIEWYLGKGVNAALEDVAPGKQITPEFLTSLTYYQAQLLRKVLLDGDGHRHGSTNQHSKWVQLDASRKDAYQMLCAMLGVRTRSADDRVYEYTSRHIQSRETANSAERAYSEDGKIWCPTVSNGIWFARRNGSTYWTGNTAPDGTRVPHTYVEIITPDEIKEYQDDKLFNRRPNPLGRIPVVHIRHGSIQGSPWGVTPLWDITGTNREYNEKVAEISEIINYYAAPITVITGGKPPELERGPSNAWGVDSADAKVFNLTGGFEGLSGAFQELEILKTYMFEKMGVPIKALGQEQEISNTSGVALSIQFFCTMQVFERVQVGFTPGLKEISELALLTLFLAEPESRLYNSDTDGIREEDNQPLELDIYDPVIYDIVPKWESPLPVDEIVRLEVIQLKLGLKLLSRRGALKELNEEFPDEVLQELAQELLEDAKDQSAIDMLKALVAAVSMATTGVVPEGSGEAVPPQPVQTGPDGGEIAQPAPPPGQQALPVPDLSKYLGEDSRNVVADLARRAWGMTQASSRDLEEGITDK